jgi:hypothetical protein
VTSVFRGGHTERFADIDKALAQIEDASSSKATDLVADETIILRG